MDLPAGMKAPPLRLADGEQVIQVESGLRRKGLFGNRYGALYVTNQRVAFVKALMVTGGALGAAIVGGIHKLGAKPMLSFDRAAITAVEKVPKKKVVELVITAGGPPERFMLDEAAVDGLVAMLSPAAT